MKEANFTNNQEPEPPAHITIRVRDLNGRSGTGSYRFCRGRGSDSCLCGSSGLLSVFMASAVV